MSVDDQELVLVTSEMQGSGDGWRVGAYDLSLDALQAGSHSVAFSIANAGAGDGEFGWDAFSLLAQ